MSTALSSISNRSRAIRLQPKFQLSLEEAKRKYDGVDPQMTTIGFVTFKRTYSRAVEGENRTEDWIESLVRQVNGVLAIGTPLTEEEAWKLLDHLYWRRCMLSGRSMWSLGSGGIESDFSRLVNCWVCTIDSIESYLFMFDQLMLGGGVGFNIQREYVHQLPPVKEDVYVVRRDSNDADFIIPDSRQGWVKLLREVLNAYFVTGVSFSFASHCIRSKGAPIKGFGGTASGPEDLCNGMMKISKILQEAEGRRITPVEAMDIANIIGSIVVAGNVRRSSQISLGDLDDRDFLRAKRWDLQMVPDHRSMSNNSVNCSDIKDLPNLFWEGYGKAGEPYGLINLDLFRKVGRLGENRADSRIVGVNPCAEIGLEGGESCNLAQLVLPNIRTEAEMHECARFLYLVTKTICAGPYAWPKTQEVVSRNRRLGISITGIAQKNPALGWLDSTYRYLRKLDRDYSKQAGVPESIRMTTVQPDGTKALISNVTSGIHGAYSQYYIRRMRIASSDPLIQKLRESGYDMEPRKRMDGGHDTGTMVVDFPVECPPGAKIADEMSAIEQLELQKKIQTEWADNSISCTVTYKDDELPAIREWLEKNYKTSVKTVSFLRYEKHGFEQAPLEPISKEKFEELSAKVKPVWGFRGGVEELDAPDDPSCVGGVCPVR